MVAILHHDLSFAAPDTALPPSNLEAEEAILGGILFDPNAIHAVKDRLKPEHFCDLTKSHATIYQACLTLARRGEPTDLISVKAHLEDRKLLAKAGGLNKLVNLVDVVPSSINIDSLARLVMEKAVRRDLIKLGSQFTHLGYSGDYELSDILKIVKKNTEAIINTPSVQTEEENTRWNYNRLLEQLKVINTTIPEPGFRLWKLQKLADEFGVSIKFLDNIYLKELAGQCSKLMTYEELKEAAGSTVREWLMNGLVTKKTTIELFADGGIGKTKFIYGICKKIIQGENWGDFSATGSKRRVLYYQGDESEGDMLQSLEMLGYGEQDINKHIRVRFGWSTEQMSVLIQDLVEFKPDVVVIDSLSTANRYSIYKESDMEYARPILEINGLLRQHNCTCVIIHHANRDGGSRGTTAIRNAVSEVWKLTKDTSESGSANHRILEIDKSRSRSSGTKYRLYFEPEDLSFEFLGEATEEPPMPSYGKIITFFSSHRNTYYTAKDVAEALEINLATCRRVLKKLSADGMISVLLNYKNTAANCYYLTYEGDDETPPDHPLITPVITPSDHTSDSCTASDSEKGDHSTPKKTFSKVEEDDAKKNEVVSTKTPEVPQDNNHRGDHRGDQGGDHRGDHRGDQGGDQENDLLPLIKILLYSPIGKIKATATNYESDKWEVKLVLPDNSEVASSCVARTEKQAQRKLQSCFDKWLENLRFTVYDPTEKTFWVEGCKCSKLPNYALGEKDVEFTTPTGKKIVEWRKDYYKVEVKHE
jgi:replicative DNA helicase